MDSRKLDNVLTGIVHGCGFFDLDNGDNSDERNDADAAKECGQP